MTLTAGCDFLRARERLTSETGCSERFLKVRHDATASGWADVLAAAEHDLWQSHSEGVSNLLFFGLRRAVEELGHERINTRLVGHQGRQTVASPRPHSLTCGIPEVLDKGALNLGVEGADKSRNVAEQGRQRSQNSGLDRCWHPLAQNTDQWASDL